MYKIYNKSYYNANTFIVKINLYILKMILHNINIIMTLFKSSTYIPEIFSMKQQNQLIQYWKDTSNLIETIQPNTINTSPDI